ncbi:MAG: hypothetical protein CM1200mP1_12430 [Candidatus Neomarinimicrobiota bacterium]|nr:MAG: hypothetical protein CM1200mP1_12430 [Candidatus Neomarinimicrobiota bacterium]
MEEIILQLKNESIRLTDWVNSGVIFGNFQIKKMYWRYFLWQFAGGGPSTTPMLRLWANSNQDGVDWFQFGFPLAFLFGLWECLSFPKTQRGRILRF